MNPCILVLATMPATAAHTARYAAWGQPLGLCPVVLPCPRYPLLYEPALVEETVEQLDRPAAETLAALRALVGCLPEPAEAGAATGLVAEDVAAASRRYPPLLLAMALGPEQGRLDELRRQVLPVLRATHRPLLLVPPAAPVAGPPRRVLVAADGEPFTLAAPARGLRALLGSWAAAYTVAHIDWHSALLGTSGRLARADVRASGLLSPAIPLALHKVAGLAPAAGVLQAVADTQADLLVLIARPRSFLDELFPRSVTAAVLHQSRVPVLLLPAAG